MSDTKMPWRNSFSGVININNVSMLIVTCLLLYINIAIIIYWHYYNYKSFLNIRIMSTSYFKEIHVEDCQLDKKKNYSKSR